MIVHNAPPLVRRISTPASQKRGSPTQQCRLQLRQLTPRENPVTALMKLQQQTRCSLGTERSLQLVTAT